ncbi:MAG: response regulator, partial [Alkalispirochaetaceae bacterium]
MSGEKVLVVEDERIVALDIKTQLERFGYIVPATFARAEDALAYLASEPPDLVLMDIHLAGKLDGITAAGRIRRDYHLPVILLTAYSDEATIERARASKPYAYLIKPFNARELRTSIVIAIERHALEKQVRERQMILDTVVENVGEGILLCDRDETVRYANGIAASMLGVEQRELENEPLGAVVRFEEGVGIEEAISSRGYATLCSRRGAGVPVDIRMAEVPGGDRV